MDRPASPDRSEPFASNWNQILKFPVFSDCRKLFVKSARYRGDEFGTGLIMKAIFTNFLKNDAGATAIEYGLIAALIAVVVITGVTAVGTQLSTTFTNLSGNLK